MSDDLSSEKLQGVCGLYTKAVKWLTIGDIIAEDIVKNGKTIIKSETPVSLRIILKLQANGVQYVKVKNSPFLTDHHSVYMAENTVSSEFVQEIIYDFLINNNKNYRYSYFLKTKEAVDTITNMVENVSVNENAKNLLSALKLWDIYCFNHVVDVFIIGTLWMHHLKLNPTTEDGIGFLLHDIGKIRIPREILLKEDNLPYHEFELLKKHTVYGAEILEKFNFSKKICEMAKYHHVRMNRTGYPKPYPKELSLHVKILMIVDSFSAITLDRPYREAHSFRQGLEILREEKELYDRELLEQFVSFIEGQIFR